MHQDIFSTISKGISKSSFIWEAVACSSSTRFSWELARMSQAPLWTYWQNLLFKQVSGDLLEPSSIDVSHTGQDICHGLQLCRLLPDFQAKWIFLIPLHLAIDRILIPSLVCSSLFVYWNNIGMFQRERKRGGKGEGRENERNGHQCIYLILIQNLPRQVLAITD